ncbi:MAG: hypothetical protein OXC38_05335 [Gammaproteobacteria bacterium]|nr:hypothetical protein [Gammaproteobacteria bacterium]
MEILQEALVAVSGMYSQPRTEFPGQGGLKKASRSRMGDKARKGFDAIILLSFMLFYERNT